MRTPMGRQPARRRPVAWAALSAVLLLAVLPPSESLTTLLRPRDLEHRARQHGFVVAGYCRDKRKPECRALVRAMEAAEDRFTGTPVKFVMLANTPKQPWRRIAGDAAVGLWHACHDGAALSTATGLNLSAPGALTAGGVAAFAVHVAETAGPACIGRLLRSKLPAGTVAPAPLHGAAAAAAPRPRLAAAAEAAAGAAQPRRPPQPLRGTAARSSCVVSGACASPWVTSLSTSDLMPGGRVAESPRAWFVLFCDAAQRSCTDLVPTWVAAARKLARAKMHVGAMDCGAHDAGCRLLGPRPAGAPPAWAARPAHGGPAAPPAPRAALFVPSRGGAPGAEQYEGEWRADALAAFARARARAGRRQQRLSAIPIKAPAVATLATSSAAPPAVASAKRPCGRGRASAAAPSPAPRPAALVPVPPPSALVPMPAPPSLVPAVAPSAAAAAAALFGGGGVQRSRPAMQPRWASLGATLWAGGCPGRAAFEEVAAGSLRRRQRAALAAAVPAAAARRAAAAFPWAVIPLPGTPQNESAPAVPVGAEAKTSAKAEETQAPLIARGPSPAASNTTTASMPFGATWPALPWRSPANPAPRANRNATPASRRASRRNRGGSGATGGLRGAPVAVAAARVLCMLSMRNQSATDLLRLWHWSVFAARPHAMLPAPVALVVPAWAVAQRQPLATGPPVVLSNVSIVFPDASNGVIAPRQRLRQRWANATRRRARPLAPPPQLRWWEPVAVAAPPRPTANKTHRTRHAAVVPALPWWWEPAAAGAAASKHHRPAAASVYQRLPLYWVPKPRGWWESLQLPPCPLPQSGRKLWWHERPAAAQNWAPWARAAPARNASHATTPAAPAITRRCYPNTSVQRMAPAWSYTGPLPPTTSPHAGRRGGAATMPATPRWPTAPPTTLDPLHLAAYTAVLAASWVTVAALAVAIVAPGAPRAAAAALSGAVGGFQHGAHAAGAAAAAAWRAAADFLFAPEGPAAATSYVSADGSDGDQASGSGSEAGGEQEERGGADEQLPGAFEPEDEDGVFVEAPTTAPERAPAPAGADAVDAPPPPAPARRGLTSWLFPGRAAPEPPPPAASLTASASDAAASLASDSELQLLALVAETHADRQEARRALAALQAAAANRDRDVGEQVAALAASTEDAGRVSRAAAATSHAAVALAASAAGAVAALTAERDAMRAALLRVADALAAAAPAVAGPGGAALRRAATELRREAGAAADEKLADSLLCSPLTGPGPAPAAAAPTAAGSSTTSGPLPGLTPALLPVSSSSRAPSGLPDDAPIVPVLPSSPPASDASPRASDSLDGEWVEVDAA